MKYEHKNIKQFTCITSVILCHISCLCSIQEIKFLQNLISMLASRRQRSKNSKSFLLLA